MVWQSIPATLTCTQLYTCTGSFCYQHITQDLTISGNRHLCSSSSTSWSSQHIGYSAVKASQHLQVTFRWLLHEMELKSASLQRTIVFCRSIKNYASLLKLFLTHLREKSYEPVGSELLIKNRLFAIFHVEIDDSEKDEILTLLKDPDGKCGLVFHTVAFGIGVKHQVYISSSLETTPLPPPPHTHTHWYWWLLSGMW